jgi:hypothetical protein
MLSDIERFKALPQDAQDAILDKHRDWNVSDSYDWWDGVYEQFIEKMKENGIEVYTRTQRTARGRMYEEPAIYFRGFWSQGDGACFEGRVLDWNLVLTTHNFPLLMQHREEFNTMQFSWKSSGNYCHEHTLSFDDEDSYPVYLTAYDDLPELRRIAVEQLHNELATEWSQFREHFEEVVKNYCRELYSDLEKEHEYLCSDEAILDSLSANDLLVELIEEYESENEESESA